MSFRSLLAMGTVALAVVACGSRPAPPLNVVLVVVDTLRADRLGVYGYTRPTSPHIDALAARGTVYRSAYAQGTWTGPSMISLMTGLYVSDEEERLPAERPVLAELLADAGLETVAFVGNPILSRDRGFDRGFDRFDGPVPGGRARSVFARFQEWFGERRRSELRPRGFFAWLHVTDPHTPYEPAPEFRRFDGEPRVDEADLRRRWRDVVPRPAVTPTAERPLTFDEAATLIRDESNRYDGEVLGTDDAIGELIEFLRANGELDRTLFILASDHGEELYEHGKYPEDLRIWMRQSPTGMGLGVKDLLEWAHGSCFHDEVWRVPMVIRGPGFPAGLERDGLAANLDLLPTILAALDRPRPPGLPGESLVGGVRPERRQVFGYSRGAAAVIDDRGFKLVDRTRKRPIYPDWALGPEDESTLLQLFDLNEDPAETTDVRAERSDVAAALGKAIDRWFERSARAVDRRLSDSDVEALRQLGYLDVK